MQKKEFLSLLKEVVDVLDKEKIKYDIPYVHLDKTEYEYINILITDNIDVFELNKLFVFGKSHEENYIVYTLYKEFPINFIRTNIDEWSYVFYYYCWNILPVLVDSICRKFNMTYTRRGLYYLHGERSILISNNLKNIFGFLEMNFNMLIPNEINKDYVVANKKVSSDVLHRYPGFLNEAYIYLFVLESPYFDHNSFTIDNFRNFDPMFKYNIKYYDNFLGHYCPPLSFVSIEDQGFIEMIDNFFNCNLLEKLSGMEFKNSLPSDIKEIEKDVLQTDLKQTSIEDLLKRKEKELLLYKQKKKINLKKLFKIDEKKNLKKLDDNNYSVEI